MCRGSPAISLQSSANARQRGERACLRVGEQRELLGDALRVPAVGELREPLESANGRPSALPTSRIAPRER